MKGVHPILRSPGEDLHLSKLLLLLLAQLQQLLSSSQVRTSISLRLRWESSVRGPQINERLHRLQLSRLHHIKRNGSEDEVREHRVELLLQVQVVEWLGEVGPVEVSVDAEHLAEDGLANLEEVAWEAGGLADPVVTGESRDWKVGGGWSRSRGRTWVGGSGWESAGSWGSWSTEIVGVGDGAWVSWEDLRVLNLAGNPALHQSDILVSWNLHWLTAGVEPREGVVAVGQVRWVQEIREKGHIRSGRHPWALSRIANGGPILGLVVNDLDESPEVAVMLDDCFHVSVTHVTGMVRLNSPWCATHSPISSVFGLVDKVMKLPLTMCLACTAFNQSGFCCGKLYAANGSFGSAGALFMDPLD